MIHETTTPPGTKNAAGSNRLWKTYEKKGGNINLLTGTRRFEQSTVSPSVPRIRTIDRVDTALALAGNSDVNAAIDWCGMHGYHTNAPFKGTLEALFRVMQLDDLDLGLARTLWAEMYREGTPDPEGVQLGMLGND